MFRARIVCALGVGTPSRSDDKGGKGGGKGKVSEAAKRALRENTELHGRVAAMTETLQVQNYAF